MRLARRLLLLALALTAAVLPAAAFAAEPSTRGEAEDALQEAQQVLDGQGVRTGREATPALARLAAGKSLLDSADRRKANGLLARPTDSAAVVGDEAYTTGEATPFCTTSFCIHYVTSTDDAPSLTDADSDSIPDYVELMAQEFEYVRSVENGADQMGWRAPVSDGTRGGNAKTDVYIKQLGDQGIFGYASTEGSGQTRSAYQVMDDDYSEFAPTTPVDARQVTAAHEYNHVLQFAYDTYQDSWMFEATATWAEEQVYPAINDYLSYLGRWSTCTETPLTSFIPDDPSCGLKVYGSAVWNHWLSTASGRYGRDLIRRSWEISEQTSGDPAVGDFAPAAYDAAIKEVQPTRSFADEFGRFSAATAEWQRAAFPDAGAYRDVERAGTLTIDGSAGTTQRLDNTTFRLLNVVPDAGKPQVRLHADLPAGLAGAVALVGRRADNTLETQYATPQANGAADVTLANPGEYQRITAVLVNADSTRAGTASSPQAGPDGQWIYARNAQPFCNVAVLSSQTGAGQASACTTATPPTSPTSQPSPPPPLPSSGGGSTATPSPAPALVSRLALKSTQRLSSVLARGVSFRLRCNRACRVKGRLRLAGAGTRGLKRNQTIGTVSTRLSKAGVKTIRIKLTRKARAALRSQRRVKVKLALVVVPSSGKSKTITRTLTLRR